jgi:heme-degrading monooxygenase HmoA
MIARIWRGQATRENAEAYQRHVTGKVFPALKAIEGHKGAYLLQRDTADGTEFLAVTLWESLQSSGSLPATVKRWRWWSRPRRRCWPITTISPATIR